MRRLAAIMFTDIVGYSKLMHTNESLALDLLEEHRAILRPIFVQYEGREIETAGDSFFVEFKSAVEAANCGIEIQTALYNRNKSLDKDQQIQIRIGLHIGDVVHLKDHVHGDGVNIAARIEPLAQSGGICVSEDVARQIRNKVKYPVVKLGRGELKNISMPMDVYFIRLPWLKTRENFKKYFLSKQIVKYGALALLILISASVLFYVKKNYKAKEPYSKYRLAILPMTNISADDKDEYFVDGMTEELISTLSQLSGLNVIARTSMMKYKDANKNISEIGDELMVGTILQGSIQKVENKARISVQLIDVSTQEHIWSKKFDRDLEDIFKVQSEIAQNIASELRVRLIASERLQLEKHYTNNNLAFQEYLIGKHLLNKKTAEGIESSIIHFDLSIKHDPQFSLPYANLAYCYTLMGSAGYGNISRDFARNKAIEYVNEALTIDETLAEAHAALGYIRYRIDWDWKGAEEEFRRAINLKPSYAMVHVWYAVFLSLHSRFNEARSEMSTALALDPLSPSVNDGLARIYHFNGEYDNAIEQYEKTFQLEPNYATSYMGLGMTYNKIEEFDKAILNLKKSVEYSNRRPIALGLLGHVYANTGKFEEANKILSELESPPVNNHNLFATCLIKPFLGQTDEALDNLEKLYEEKYGIMVYMKAEDNLFGLNDYPRFMNILKKMGLE